MNLIVLPFLIPVLTALICCIFFGLPTVKRRIMIVVSSVVQLGLALYLTSRALSSELPLVQNLGDWSSMLGIVLVVDGLAGIMLCLSTFVSLMCILFSYAEVSAEQEQPLRLPLMQLLVAGINLSFITGDLFNLFVAFEIMLVASYALLTLEANNRHIKEAFPYLSVNLVGSALFLITAGVAYAVFGTLNFAHMSERAAELGTTFPVRLVAILLMVVFGIKAGVFPLYYWLPNSYPILSLSLGAFYSGLLTKVGIYVMLRMLGTVFPHDLDAIYLLLAWLAGLTMVLAVLGAVSRNFIRGILSFHIVSQIGYMILAIGLFTPLSIAACIFYVIHHIVVKSSLFLVGGAAMFYNHTDHLKRMGGLWKASPLLGICFLCQAFSLAGVPPLSGFWGKYLIILVGLDEGRYWLVMAAIVASILTVVSMLKIWLGAFWKDAPPDEPLEPVCARIRAMTAIIAVFTLVSLGIGFGAEGVMRISRNAGDSLLNQENYRQAVFLYQGKGGTP
ncbi:MAG: proton-conducting transporter membrane subunit [Luteolibacter sp.]